METGGVVSVARRKMPGDRLIQADPAEMPQNNDNDQDSTSKKHVPEPSIDVQPLQNGNAPIAADSEGVHDLEQETTLNAATIDSSKLDDGAANGVEPATEPERHPEIEAEPELEHDGGGEGEEDTVIY